MSPSYHPAGASPLPLDVGYLPQLLQGLPSLVLGAEDTMVFTPNFRNVGSLAGETAACDEPPCQLPGMGSPGPMARCPWELQGALASGATCCGGHTASGQVGWGSANEDQILCQEAPVAFPMWKKQKNKTKKNSSKTFEMSWIYTPVEEEHGTIKKNKLLKCFL